MNVTILSFLTSALLSNSPAFVGKNIKMKNCNFQKFMTFLFYNQQRLDIQNTIFTKGLNGVIQRDGIIDSVIINGTSGYHNETIISNETFTNVINGKFGENAVFKIMNCFFNEIKFNYQGIIYVHRASFYLTDSTFSNCNGIKNPIYLDQSRCNTISHICCVNTTVNYESAFIYGDGKKGDFFIFIYSSYVGKTKEQQNGEYLTFVKYGKQYHHCLNFSNLNQGQCVVQFQSPQYFSQRFISFENVKESTLIKISDSIDNYDLKSEMICVYNQVTVSWNGLIYFTFDGLKTIRYTIENCVFVINDNSQKNLISLSRQDVIFICSLINCTLNDKINIPHDADRQNIRVDNAHLITPIELPHYTKKGYCNGVENPTDIIANCDIGECLNNDDCQTITFPTDVVSYTTIFHQEFHKETPTPTQSFTRSNIFSKSNAFSRSNDFSKSNIFSKSSAFSASHTFSNSDHFSQSNFFTESSSFTKTKEFTDSQKFSNSDKFTKSLLFSQSSHFSESNSFSNSKEFSPSNTHQQTSEFTKSSDFTESNTFTKSLDFNATSYFTNSHTFSPSHSFTSSDEFTFSKEFTKSLDFSQSNKFSMSDTFTRSLTFSFSSEFTSSIQFTSSDTFTSSECFTSSSVFTESSEFEATNEFTMSDIFSHSFYFTKSNVFDPTNSFTYSKSFSESSEFSKSVIFSSSIGFSETDSFSESISFKNNVIIPVVHDDSDDDSQKMQIGIGVAIGVAAVGAGVGMFFLFYKRRKPASGLFEGIEMPGKETNPYMVENTLNQLMTDDDPFAKEFVDSESSHSFE